MNAEKKFTEKIEAPEEVTISVSDRKVTVKGPNGEVSKEFKMPTFGFESDGNSLILNCDSYTRYDNINFKTIVAHVNNMFKGVNEGFVYKLKICSSHFPMNVSLSGNKLIVKNLLGEKVPRELIIKEGVKVEIKEDIIEVTGPDKDLVSTTASDIEQLTKITNKDRRIFQDGLYIIEKDGKKV